MVRKSKSPNKVRGAQCKDTDVIMARTWLNLCSDLEGALGMNLLPRHKEAMLQCLPKRDFGAFRLTPMPSGTIWTRDVYWFKAHTQLETFLKRYTFQHDLFTKPQLSDITDMKFLDLQVKLANYRLPSGVLRPLIRRARWHVGRILGQYSLDEHVSLCRFGKRAVKGHTAKDSYLDLKLNGPITGSEAHTKWFVEHYLPTDNILRDVLKSTNAKYEHTWFLNQTNVPKSYKSLRGITPNTLLGSFYTYGLGRVIQNRLADEGLDIRYLQRDHGFMAKRASVDRRYVTADLSSASHCFTAQTVNMLVPRKWYNVLKFGRIPYVQMGNKDSDPIIRQESFMAMGIGFTFPLQTLLFYSLIKAVQDLSKIGGRVSVYGDDLIYPTRIHSGVKCLLNAFRFELNNDKTFVKSHFRESCGSDFFHGVDVRPCNPEGEHQVLRGQRYVAFLYKLINSLLRRWTVHELPKTLHMLLTEVATTSGRVFPVPPDFPDYAGIKVDIGDRWVKDFWYVPWVKPQHNANGSLTFPMLKQVPRDRYVQNVYAYYWDKLRSMSQNEDLEIEYDTDLFDDTPSALRWVKAQYQPKNYRSLVTGKRLTLLHAVVPKKGETGNYVCQTAVAISTPMADSFEEFGNTHL